MTIYNAILFQGLVPNSGGRALARYKVNRAIIDRLACFEQDNGFNGPCSVYTTPRFSGPFSMFGLVFIVLNSPLGETRQWNLKKFAILLVKPRCHVRILI